MSQDDRRKDASEEEVPEPLARLEKFLEGAPEERIKHPVAPWRKGSYSHANGSDFPDLVEEPIAVRRLREAFPKEILAFRGYRGDATVLMGPSAVVDAIRFLRDDAALTFDLLRDLFSVDNLKTEARILEFAAAGLSNVRFEVVYHLYSLRHRQELRIRVGLPEADPKIPTLSNVYLAANWFEREAWEMYGIDFVGHPNLRRLITHESFEGHPLRKDYPINRRHNFVTPTTL